MIFVAKKLASDLNLKNWYKLLLNTWEMYQEVPHIHMHMLSDL
jgi:hypothetical protein